MQPESLYDEEAEAKEERQKLAYLFDKKERRVSSASGSKVKLPYDMLISKLVDSLETPDIISRKMLPVPAGFESTE